LVAQISKGRLQLGGLFNGLKVNVDTYKDTIDQFKTLNFDLSRYKINDTNTFNWNAIAASIDNCDERALSYFKTLDNGDGTIDTQSASISRLSTHLEKTGQSYSFAALKATLLNTALNASIALFASFAIQAIVKGLDQYIHRAERAREAAEQAQQAIDASQSRLQKITSTLSVTQDKFLELSKGVSKFSKNLSLSEEDYAEYLSISNQLAELFPSLVYGYNEQGNALLLLGENADETRKKLQALMETQQIVAQQSLIDNMDSVAAGTYYDVKEARETIARLRNDLTDSQAKRKKLDIDLKSSHNLVSFHDGDYQKYGKIMENALNSAGIAFEVNPLIGEAAISIQIDPSTDSRSLEEAQKFYDAQLEMENELAKAQENKLKTDIQKQEDNIKTAYSKMNANLQAWMKDNYIYQYLPDSMADLADALVPAIEWDQLDLPLTSGIDYQNYINQKILNPLMSIPQESKEKINSMIRTLLSFEEGDLNILPFAETLQAELKELGISINITPVIANEQDTKAKLRNSIENIARGSDYYTASGNQVDAKELNELTEYTKEFNTEQIEQWNKVTLNCNSAEEAIAKYKESLKSIESAESFTHTLSDSINQLTTQLAPQFTKLGEAYRSIFTKEDFAKDAIDNSMFSEILKSFTELGKEAGVAFDASNLDTFFGVLANADSTSSQVQQAFNDLATTYLYSTETLEYLNEETADAIEKQLAEMGVANASELVYDTLNTKLDALTLQKQLLAAETEAAANKTTFNTAEFLKEANASEAAKACLFNLTATEQIFGKTDISTEEKVKELKELAAAYGQTAIVTRIANLEEAAQEEHIPIDYDKELAALQNEINNSVNNIPITFIASDDISSAAGTGKAAGDAYMDAFEKELSSLEDLRNNGIISEKEYLDRLRLLYERYFKDRQQYAKQYTQYEHEYLSGYKSLYESVFSHAAGLVGDRISLLQDEKDAALDSLEAQKKAAEDSYDAQIRLLEDKKSALQSEIDKIKEANEDRKEAITLQEKERNLAKAENQHTVLQYSAERGFYYEADAEAIQEARTELETAKEDAQIRALEKQQDALDRQIEAIQEMADASNEYWEAQKEQTEQYYDTLLDRMEEYKGRWEELSGLQEQAGRNALLKELGYSETDLQNESSGALESLTLSYLGILKDLNAGNHAVLDSLSLLTDTDLHNIPGFLEQTRQSLDTLSDVNISSLSEDLNGMSDGFSDIAASASDAAAAILGDNTASAGGERQNPAEGAENPAASGHTSLKTALNDLAAESVDSIHRISDAFAGEDEEGTSVTEAVKKVTDKIGSTDPDNADPESLMAVLREQTAQALDEESGIPAQRQAWIALNEPLGQAAETVAAIKKDLKDMDGKTFSVALNVLGNGGPLAGSIVSDFNIPGDNGQTPPDNSNNSHGGEGHSRQLISFPHEDDHSGFAEIYRKFNAAMEDPVRRADFLAAAPKLNPVSRVTALTGQSNYNNISNKNIYPTITGGLNITCPGITSSEVAKQVGIALQHEFNGLSNRALQESMLRR